MEVLGRKGLERRAESLSGVGDVGLPTRVFFPLRQTWVPAFEAVIQLAFIAPRYNFAIPAQAGTHRAAGVELSDGTRSQKAIKLRCLWKHGSRPAPGWREKVIAES